MVFLKNIFNFAGVAGEKSSLKKVDLVEKGPNIEMGYTHFLRGNFFTI